jgi:predicted DNA-binding transcriptional regulator AlpA
MSPEARDLIRAVLDAPERAAEIPPESVPGLLVYLAALQTALSARLLSAPNGHGKAPAAPAEPDRLLTAEEAAPVMGVKPRWLYRHARQLPFARRLSRKALRFSEIGLRRYIATRRA